MLKEYFNVEAERLQSLFPLWREKTRAEIGKVLKALNLPLPKDAAILHAAGGRIIFLNDYGIVIRVEYNKEFEAERFGNKHPWILQPLKSFDAGEAVVEICPGCHPAAICSPNVVQRAIRDAGGAAFWDYKELNVGRLPLRTPAFPDGIPVVIDRLAVSVLSRSALDVKKALALMSVEEDPQPRIYGRLIRALDDAFANGVDNPDGEKVKAFWRLCKQELADGTLVSGWTESTRAPHAHKQRAANDTGKRYSRQLRWRRPDK